MIFPGILGHGETLTRLAHAALNRRPHHAYIFHGYEGVGRRLVALAFATSLNCEALPGDRGGDTPAYCGECGSCRRIGA